MKQLSKNSRTFSTNNAFYNFNGKTCIEELKGHYQSLDHKRLIFALYKLEDNFEIYKSKMRECSIYEIPLYANKIKSLLVELDYISLSLAKYQDCGISIDMLYEDMYETTINIPERSKHD